MHFLLIPFRRPDRIPMRSCNEIGTNSVLPAKLTPQINRPAGFFQNDIRLCWSGHRVDDLAVWSAEIAGNVAAVLLNVSVDVSDFKVADLLEAGDKVLSDKISDVLIRQSTCSVFLSVVSGEARSLKVAGHMHHEDKPILCPRELHRFIR